MPWLTSLIESAKLPGGWEIRFRDLQDAGRQVSAGQRTRKRSPDPDAILEVVSQPDPNLALVGLRIEIERRIRRFAELGRVDRRQPLSRLLLDLYRLGILPGSVYEGLKEIVAAGNQAAHGARVEPEVSDWALAHGPDILAVLDDLLEPRDNGDHSTT